MGYIFEQRLNLSQAHFTRLRMNEAIKAGKSFNRYQREMITAGTGYKRLDMLADWNRGKAVETARRADGYERAKQWYDNVAIPWMKKVKKTVTEFFGWKSRSKYDPFMTLEDEEEYWEYEEELEEEFPDLYHHD